MEPQPRSLKNGVKCFVLLAALFTFSRLNAQMQVYVLWHCYSDACSGVGAGYDAFRG
jgi:hypothetical protein